MYLSSFHYFCLGLNNLEQCNGIQKFIIETVLVQAAQRLKFKELGECMARTNADQRDARLRLAALKAEAERIEANSDQLESRRTDLHSIIAESFTPPAAPPSTPPYAAPPPVAFPGFGPPCAGQGGSSCVAGSSPDLIVFVDLPAPLATLPPVIASPQAAVVNVDPPGSSPLAPPDEDCDICHKSADHPQVKSPAMPPAQTSTCLSGDSSPDSQAVADTPPSEDTTGGCVIMVVSYDESDREAQIDADVAREAAEAREAREAKTRRVSAAILQGADKSTRKRRLADSGLTYFSDVPVKTPRLAGKVLPRAEEWPASPRSTGRRGSHGAILFSPTELMRMLQFHDYFVWYFQDYFCFGPGTSGPQSIRGRMLASCIAATDPGPVSPVCPDTTGPRLPWTYGSVFLGPSVVSKNSPKAPGGGVPLPSSFLHPSHCNYGSYSRKLAKMLDEIGQAAPYLHRVDWEVVYRKLFPEYLTQTQPFDVIYLTPTCNPRRRSPDDDNDFAGGGGGGGTGGGGAQGIAPPLPVQMRI